jgi:hypothetical protein
VLDARATRLPFAVEVVGFGDEEGVRFNATLIGSRAVAGALPAGVLDTRDARGVSLAEALAEFGLDPARIGEAARRREAHQHVLVLQRGAERLTRGGARDQAERVGSLAAVVGASAPKCRGLGVHHARLLRRGRG